MSDFSIDDKKLKFISESFEVDIKRIRIVHAIFGKVISEVKNQYLAHIIRCMEAFIRKETGNPMFQINTFPVDPKSPNFNVGCAQYFPKRYFSIFFHPRMDDKQLRVCLAHELGHLFLIELLNEGQKKGGKTFSPATLTEPISSVFGIFTIMDKNAFYESCSELLNHDSWQSIVDSFVKLQDKAGKP
jgi:hypothetical protein